MYLLSGNSTKTTGVPDSLEGRTASGERVEFAVSECIMEYSKKRKPLED